MVEMEDRETQTLVVELEKRLADQVEARAQELGISRDKALLELILLGLERIRRLPGSNLRSHTVEQRSYYLRVGQHIYQVQAEHPRQAILDYLRQNAATQAAVGAPQLGSQGQQVYTVVGFAVPEIEVFSEYPKPGLP